MKIELPEFKDVSVLVVGDVMLDRYWYGTTSRISPEAPVPVVHVGDSEERPGGAANVALNVTALGANASVISMTGADDTAADLVENMSAAGVDCYFQKIPGIPTITKLRVISRHQQLIRLDFEGGFEAVDSSGLISDCQKQLADCDLLLLSDYGKGTLNAVQTLIDMARTAGKPVLVDPKGSDLTCYRGATLLTPNLSEFEAVVGRCQSDEELVQKGQVLCDELQLQALLITRSERGMTLLQKDQPALHLPTRAREVFDVTGAGDTVIAVLAAALAAGQSLQKATVLANLAAGIVVGKLGTASVTLKEIRQAMREQDEVERGVMDEALLLAAVTEARSHGETLVMTNGCFDILHAGHVTYLNQARALGDRLIVAVNDDASVKRLKGEERPVNALEQRMHVLAGLECVDWVVPFSEDTPTRLICAVSPDVLVKGGDNDPDKIPGGKCVREAGGRVEIMGFVNDLSTTNLINAIRASEKATD